MKSICRNRQLCSPLAPMKLGFSNQRKPASSPSIARVAATAVISEITVPIISISAKPFTPGGRDREQHQRRDHRHDVGVDDRVEALRVAGADRGAHGLPGPHLFLDPLEDDDVRVGRDADRQDQAGEARQRQRDVEEQDRRVEERRVDAEPDDRDDAEEAVEHEQEDRDHEQADQRGELRLLERVLAERGRDVGALDLLELDRQRAGLEDERQVLRLADARDVRDLGARAGRVDPVRVLLVVDVRRRARAGRRARSRSAGRTAGSWPASLPVWPAAAACRCAALGLGLGDVLELLRRPCR